MAAKDVNTLLSELAAALTPPDEDAEQDPEAILACCDQVLGLPEGEHSREVELCRAIALLNCSRYPEALTQVAAIPKEGPLAAALTQVHAYCLYKTEALAEALTFAKGGVDEALLQVQAQVLYRQGDFRAAVAGFKKVKDVMAEEEDSSELVANMMAAYALCQPGDAALEEEFEALGAQVVEEGSAFELMYNVAAAQIERHSFEAAAATLEATRGSCVESLEEDDFNEEEIQKELAPILTQLGFVQQRLQQKDAAMGQYQAVLGHKPSDKQVVAVAMNNVVSLKGEKDLFDSLKKTKQAQNEATESKLTLRQKKAIAFNRALLLLFMNKADQCGEYLKILEAAYPGDTLIGLLKAAILARSSPAKAEAALEDAIASADGSTATVLGLSLAQLQLRSGAHKKAIATLLGIASLQHRPGLLATLTALYEQHHEPEAAIAAVEAAIAYWTTTQTERDVKETVLREGAKYLLRNKRPEAAAAAFEALLQLRKDDPSGVAGLVQAYGMFDPDQAEKYAERIPALEGADEIDAEALEEETVEAANKGSRRSKDGAIEDADAAATAAAESAASEALATKRRALRQEKRKATLEKRLPRDLVGKDPATWRPLDAERWLPKRDRSYYKARRGQKKRGVDARGGAQGAAMSDAHNKLYDRSDDAAHNKAAAPESPPPQQQKSGKKGGGKKKK